MKICLFGATGLLGSAFKKALVDFEVLSPNRGEVQLLDFGGTLSYLNTHKPDLIINCAAYTNVDQAESDAENCEQINVDVVRNLTKSGIPMIHFSSDYVFNAPPGLEIPEDYPLSPQSVYGQSKAQAEEVLEKGDIDWWNIRTSWLFGPGGKNFINTITKLAATKSELEIIDDQIGRPTYAPDLAQYIIDNFIKTTQKCGHYHAQNSGDPVSWAEFAEFFLSLCPSPDSNESGLQTKIVKISSQDYGAPATRPKNSVLKNTKINQNLRDWRLAVTEHISE